MDKEELRGKLLVIREEYITKNQARLDKIKPLWDANQQTVPVLEDVDPVIDMCDTQEKMDLWYYGRVMVSSAPNSGEVGRRFHYLLCQKGTGFVFGMIGISSDLTIPLRDRHIGWSKKEMWEQKRINYIMNCQHVVPTPDFSQYLTGKLCALSVKSKEVQDHFFNKYGHHIAMMTVTSLFGKSSMYNRLEGFIYLGVTKGTSASLVPLAVKQQMREDYKEKHGKHSEIYYNTDGTVRQAYGVVKSTFKLKGYADTQNEANKRGVYVIPIATNYKEFLCCKTDELELPIYESFDTIKAKWRERWFLPRIQRMTDGSD